MSWRCCKSIGWRPKIMLQKHNGIGICGHDNINLRKHLGLMIMFCCSQKKQKRRLGNLPGSGMDLIVRNIVFLIIFYYR